MFKKRKWLSVGFALLLVFSLMPSTVFGFHIAEISSDGKDSGKTAFQIFQEHLGSAPVDGPGVTNIHEDYDEIIGNHFVFHIEEDEAYDSCCTDRQRLEIKGYNSSPEEVKGYPGTTITYNWFFRANEDEFAMSRGGSFNHIFQLKMVGGDDGAPVLTFSLADGKLLFRHSPIGATMNEVEVLTEANWSDIVDKWVFASVTVENNNQKGEDGKFVPAQIDMTLRNLDGSVIMEWSGKRSTWREGGNFNRPKWGIYRAVFPGMGSATLKFANFEIINHDWSNKKTFDIEGGKNNHIEAENFTSKNGFFFKESSSEASDGNYMHVPVGWSADGKEYIHYQLDVKESVVENVYLHIYGKGDSAASNTIEVSLSADAGGTEVDLPVGNWDWASIPLDVTTGLNQLYLKLVDVGAKIDKIALNNTIEPPAVSVIPRLDTLTVNGLPIQGFTSNVYEYRYKLPFEPDLAIPIIGAASSSGQVNITQPDELFGTGTVTVSNPLEPSLDVTYTIQFTGFPYPDFDEELIIHEIVSATATSSHSSGHISGAIDQDATTKWTVGGESHHAVLDIGEVKEINRILIAYDNPNQHEFELDVSEDGDNWIRVLGLTRSQGIRGELQMFSFVDIDARYIRYNAKANTRNNWTDIREFFIATGPTDSNAELPEQPIVPPTLIDLTVNGETIANFDKDQFIYNYEWPLFTTGVPIVDATSEHPISITQAEHLFDSAEIVVTHKEEQDIMVTYTVNFRGLQLRPDVELPEQFVMYEVENVTFSNEHGSHPAKNSVDGSRATRWAVSVTNGPEWAMYDLGSVKPVQYVLISHLNAHNRNLHFKIELSVDGDNWVTVFDGDSTVIPNDPSTSYNEAEDLELFVIPETDARYIRYTGNGATTVGSETKDDNWHNLIEIIFGGDIQVAEEPVSVLTGVEEVKADAEFTVRYGIEELQRDIYAQLIDVRYDPEVMEFISVESVKEGIAVLYTEIGVGQVQIILASEGEGNQITGTVELLDLTFKAKDVYENTVGTITATATLGDGEGQEIETLAASLNITVNAGIKEDVNNDGRISIGDLAIVATHYGKDNTDPNWDQIKKADINRDGLIDIEDLGIIAKRILE